MAHHGKYTSVHSPCSVCILVCPRRTSLSVAYRNHKLEQRAQVFVAAVHPSMLQEERPNNAALGVVQQIVEGDILVVAHEAAPERASSHGLSSARAGLVEDECLQDSLLVGIAGGNPGDSNFPKVADHHSRVVDSEQAVHLVVNE